MYIVKKIIKITFITTILLGITACSGSVYIHNPENIQVVGMDSDSEPIVEILGETLDIGTEVEEAEKVDLILFAGQSNMAGYGGNEDEAPIVDEKAGMEFRAISDPTRLYPIKEPFGKSENNENGLSDTDNGAYRHGTLVSSFINKYSEKTGHKVVALSASVGGMAMDLWLIPAFWNDCIDRLRCTQEWLINNGYSIEHIYLVWYQGESDIARQVSVENYSLNFNTFMDSFIAEGVEQIFLIVPNRSGTPGDSICDFQKDICEKNDKYTLGSDLPSQYNIKEYSKDNIHYVQEALNAFGEDAGQTAADYCNAQTVD